jgi:hypothetical protein
MLSCKSPLHAHPSFYLLTLFHLLSLYYLSLVLVVLVVPLSLLSLYCLFVRVLTLLPPYCLFVRVHVLLSLIFVLFPLCHLFSCSLLCFFSFACYYMDTRVWGLYK